MIDNLKKMLDSGRDDPMLRFGLASALVREKREAEAVPHLNACIEQDPSYTAAYKMLGKALYTLDRFDEALAAFNAGLPVAEESGDKQTVKEIEVFVRKIQKQT